MKGKDFWYTRNSLSWVHVVGVVCLTVLRLGWGMLERLRLLLRRRQLTQPTL
jgi:hypothetical protein